ncbi:sulfurtransferase complex subunit TusC [Shewanella sedimentimangrovi]|uniref:Sulfurtransferase complex subunit TusC n=1 Tax=Shewanella sedimentimangrovi TaxID=2814293 RepID=A0ABX7R814_9GAMM|nr:sulfurtransferase complex subunit TusC [Shewanella sedimentimangrovi]QSX38903.1 sulfurtransferase complex subunit TusC [Shewanella sedimentimangrovi]
MKKLCVVFRRGPHGTAHGREALDLAMLAASFDLEVSLLFCDEGVLHLLQDQNPEHIGCRDYISTFKALPFYDVEIQLVCKQSLVDYGLNKNGLNKNGLSGELQILDSEAITAHLQSVDEVVVY